MATIDPADVDDEPVERQDDPSPLAELFGRLFEGMAWKADAACRGEGPAPFFALEGERPEMRAAREWDARLRFCGRCPVSNECGDAGRAGREFGLWGGESEEDRATAGFGNLLMGGRAIKAYYAHLHRARGESR
jgi:WhiB family redox-sensing transcriptional regulator